MNTELTVFVVDDGEEVRDAMKRLMNSVGLTVETFASAEDFLAQFDPARPGCLLLDCVHRAIELDGKHRGRVLQLADISARLDRLTPREREILDLVVAGKRNKVIAGELGISQSTVESHRARVMEKMQAESLSDLMRMMLSLQS
jgi:FixJ family two-component response regulator